MTSEVTRAGIYISDKVHYLRAKYGSDIPYNHGQALSYARQIGDRRCAEWLEGIYPLTAQYARQWNTHPERGTR